MMRGKSDPDRRASGAPTTIDPSNQINLTNQINPTNPTNLTN
jgi:hypothetical protein